MGIQAGVIVQVFVCSKVATCAWQPPRKGARISPSCFSYLVLSPPTRYQCWSMRPSVYGRNDDLSLPRLRLKKWWPPSWVSLSCSPCLSWFTCSGGSQQLWYEDTQAACREAAHVVRNQGLQHPREWTWRGTLQPLLTVWWKPHERPWAITTHINCPQFLNSETMWGICINLLDFEVICYAVTDDWASKVAQW